MFGVPAVGIADGGTWLVTANGEARRVSPNLLCDVAPGGDRLLRCAPCDGELQAITVDGRPIELYGIGWAAAWRPPLHGSPPMAPLAARSSEMESPGATPCPTIAVWDLQSRLVALGYLHHAA